MTLCFTCFFLLISKFFHLFLRFKKFLLYTWRDSLRYISWKTLIKIKYSYLLSSKILRLIFILENNFIIIALYLIILCACVCAINISILMIRTRRSVFPTISFKSIILPRGDLYERLKREIYDCAIIDYNPHIYISIFVVRGGGFQAKCTRSACTAARFGIA